MHKIFDTPVSNIRKSQKDSGHWLMQFLLQSLSGGQYCPPLTPDRVNSSLIFGIPQEPLAPSECVVVQILTLDDSSLRFACSANTTISNLDQEAQSGKLHYTV